MALAKAFPDNFTYEPHEPTAVSTATPDVFQEQLQQGHSSLIFFINFVFLSLLAGSGLPLPTPSFSATISLHFPPL